jgi:hypothetical protein
MDDALHKFIELGITALPLVCFVGAFCFWSVVDKSGIKRWRLRSTWVAFALMFVAICLGAYALACVYRYPQSNPGLPDQTIWSMVAGALLALLALPVTFMAKSWTRVALFLSSASLLFFFYLLAISP